jgi:DNA-binding transcriptional LysR family regulator
MEPYDLRDLGAFAAIARHRNFRRAALEQRVSVSGLSQRLRTLEERLGVRLLNRTTRSVAPTEAGELLLSRVGPVLQELSDAVGAVRGLREIPSGRLRINTPAPAAQLVLAPMIAPFLQAYPAVNLEIVVETPMVDIVAAGFDAGVRYEEHLAQDMIAVSLGPPQRYTVAAAPSAIARYGTPARPKDLLELPCIAFVSPTRAAVPWEFEKAGRVVRIMPKGPFRASDPALLQQAAIEGLGFWMTFEGYAASAVASGELVTVLDDWCQSFPGPFLYYPSRRQLPPALSAFVAFAKEWRARQEPGRKTARKPSSAR